MRSPAGTLFCRAGAWVVTLSLAALVFAPAPARALQAPAHEAIASAHPAATAAGEAILVAGGNAFDAAVAVSAALAVVEPSSSGVGGGGFYLLHQAAGGRDVFVDAREAAPLAASRDMYLGSDGKPVADRSRTGPLAAAIPGEPAAWAWLAKRYGRLPLATSLAPAIRLAREGFPLYARLQSGIRYNVDRFGASPAAAQRFLVNGKVPEIGTIIRQPELARTLQVLADGGGEAFYHGRFASSLVAEVRKAGGIWTEADLAAYKVVEREPLVGNYRGARIVTAPPPSAGGIVLLDTLNILAGYDLAAQTSVTAKHLLVEAMRHAYRDRAEYLGDPDFVAVPVAELTSPLYAAGQRASIRPDRATPSATLRPIAAAVGDGPTTTHFSVLDREGNRVAATISINLWFGSGWVAPGTGVFLNDTMDDFSVATGVPNAFNLVGADANAIAPGKRSLSSMTPTFVESDKGLLIIGTPGGSTIISMVTQGVLGWLDGESAATVVAKRRLHHQYLPDQLMYEPGALTDTEIAGLRALGHNLKEWSLRGNLQVITWDYATGAIEAAADPRGAGVGLVY